MTRVCECGCGRPTALALKTNTAKGHVAGRPLRFILGHSGGNGSKIGDKTLDSYGYVLVYQPGHPNANARGWIAEHVLVAATALGKPLPRGAVVHHINEIRAENCNTNLVICENAGYHGLLHKRMDARGILAAGAKPCPKCSITKPLTDFYEDRRWLTGTSSWCKACCQAATAAQRRARAC